MTKDGEELIRKTIRIPRSIINRIANQLLRHGAFVTESEVLRNALDLGLKEMEKEKL